MHLLTGTLAAAISVLLQAAPPADVTCDAELTWIADYARRNYSGFEVKVNDSTLSRYEMLLRELRAAAARAQKVEECDAVLRRYVGFFQDGHFSFWRRAGPASTATGTSADAGGSSDDAIRERFASWERVELTDAQVRVRLAARERSPIEGIWQSLDGRYASAVLRDARDGRDYTMTIVRADAVWWVPGQTKATFTRSDSGYAVRFYMLDHSERQWQGRVRGNVLLLDGGSPWVRVWPVEAGDVSREELAVQLNTRFAVRELGPGTVLMQIPTFSDPRRMDSLWSAEAERIRASSRLIIDVRGNGGGSDYNFRNLIPLLYTQPIRIVGMSALATEDNIRAHEELAADTSVPAAQRMQMRQMIETLRAANGGWHSWPDRVHEEERVLETPRQIAIVADRGCASSCEQFLLAARQSTKVTIYGDRTAGILDFGNVRSARMPGGTLVLHHPTTRSNRLPHDPVDPHGIQPHVRIPDDELLSLQWVLRMMNEPN